MAWGKNQNLEPAMQGVDNHENLGSAVEEFEAAAAATQSPAGAEGAIPPANAEGSAAHGQMPEPSLPQLDPAIMRGLSTAVARWPFQRLAEVSKEPSWIPADDKLEALGGHVEACGTELLGKFLPEVALKYANIFPATFAMLTAFAGVMFMQWTLVMRAKIVAQNPLETKTVTVEAREVAAGMPMQPVPSPVQVAPPAVRPVSDSEPYSI